jgi:hypothetical protein
VTSQDRSIVAEETAFISPNIPFVRVYRNDPLLGPLYGTALPQNVTLAGTEDTFRAVPYHFSEKPLVTWQVNNTPSDTDPDITVRASGGGSGTALLSVSAVSAGTFQSASETFEVQFGGGGIGLFGL